MHEIYTSIQGESSHMGKPCLFIRTTGCHLRCTYCDTAHAFFDGHLESVEALVKKAKLAKVPMVELTGGEPLLQKASFSLMDALIKEGFIVLLETSGAISIKNVNPLVKVILDIKTPYSGEEHSNNLENLLLLWPGCEVKFVIASLDDYNFAKNFIKEHGLEHKKNEILFSPVVSELDPKLLVEWILKDKLNVRFQLQLHRILWGETTGK